METNDLKNKVLALLQKSEGCISGTSISRELCVSRGAVWKVVEQLRCDGFDIAATSNRGYKLQGFPASSVAAVKSGIFACMTEKSRKLFTLDLKREVTSTNTMLKALAAQSLTGSDGDEPTQRSDKVVLIAASQSSGKGRLGRSFSSPVGTGVYMSILTRPKMDASKATMLTIVAAVAVCRAIEICTDGEKSPQIKWVNDLFLSERKICGILTEASFDFETGGIDYAVTGMGVNLLPPASEGELSKIAGGIFSYGELIPDGFVNRLCAEIINQFSSLYNDNDELVEIDSSWIEEYRKRSFMLDTDIVIVGSGRVAHVLEIDDSAGLVVRYENGVISTLNSGEVSIKPN